MKTYNTPFQLKNKHKTTRNQHAIQKSLFSYEAEPKTEKILYRNMHMEHL